jgi:hypothetical protein
VPHDTHPNNSSSNLSKGDDLKKMTTEEATLDELIDLLRRCPLNGKTAEEEAAWIVRRWLSHQRRAFAGHLHDALDEKLDDPISYADRMTQRGETPRVAPLHV